MLTLGLFLMLGLSLSGAGQTPPPAATSGSLKLILYQADRLAGAKARLARKDPALQAARTRLIERADGALNVKPASVMDKKRLPPSGDKHDYTSYAPYFWPDPAKKDGLPYIMRDGRVNPETKQDADYGRMLRMATSVESLALAYYFSGDEKYAAHAALLLRTWYLDPATRMNPRLDYGQGVPGRATGHAWGIIDTVCLAHLPDSVTLLEGSKSWTKADRAGMQRWFGEYAQWLLGSGLGREEGAATNNHGTWYDVQVITYAVFAGRPETVRAIAQAAGARRIASQIEPDGRQPAELKRTKSYQYSLYNLDALFTLAAACRGAGVDLWHYASADGRSLRQALDFLLPYAAGQKKWPYEEIEGVNGQELVSFLLKAADAYGAPDYAAAAQRLGGGPLRSRSEALLENLP